MKRINFKDKMSVINFAHQLGYSTLDNGNEIICYNDCGDIVMSWMI